MARRIDPSRLAPRTRAEVEREAPPRDTPVALRFRADSVAAWRRAASAEDASLTDWIERELDAAAAKKRR